MIGGDNPKHRDELVLHLVSAWQISLIDLQLDHTIHLCCGDRREVGLSLYLVHTADHGTIESIRGYFFLIQNFLPTVFDISAAKNNRSTLDHTPKS